MLFCDCIEKKTKYFPLFNNIAKIFFYTFNWFRNQVNSLKKKKKTKKIKIYDTYCN